MTDSFFSLNLSFISTHVSLEGPDGIWVFSFNSFKQSCKWSREY